MSCVDDAPIPFDDAVTLAQGDPATPIDVLSNDSDVDGGQIEVQGLDTPRTVGYRRGHKLRIGRVHARCALLQ